MALKRPRALFVLNPAAKGCRGADHGFLKRTLASAGLEVEMVASGRPDGPAREAAGRGFDRVVVAGGDGTLRSVLCATALPVAVLPLGGSNSVARSVGVPLDAAKAAEVAARGVERALDMGEVSGPAVPGGRQPFILCASAGVDAEIARRYERVRGGSWEGMSRFAAVSVMTALRHRHAPIDVQCEGRPAARGAKLVIAANMKVYGGLFELAREARPDDGALDLVAVRGEGTLGVGSALIRAFLGLPQRPARALVRRARAMRWESALPVPLEIDGEPMGELPVEVAVRPGAARMILPR